MGRRLFLVSAAFLALGIPVAFGGSSADPGITPTTIHIGGTAPLTGSAQAFQSVAKGAEAYFKYVNARGGVNKRRIQYEYLDDQYIPSETVRQTRVLVQDKKVFAIFNSLGTEHNEAIRPYLNQLGVPHLFAATGATTFGRDYQQYPWTIAYQPTYVAEGAMYGNYIRRTMPRAKIAILYQDDSYGADLIRGLERGLGPRKGNIVARAGYAATDDNVQSQIVRLRASNAGILMLFSTPKFTIQAYQYVNGLGWKPKIFVNAVSSASNVMVISSSRGQNKRVEGSISIVFLKDPNDPKWKRDPGVLLYRKIMRKYAPGGNVKDVYNMYGMSAAFTFVDALKHAGRSPTRTSLRNAAIHLNERNNPFLLPRMVIKTTSTEHYPIDQARLQRWQKGKWISFGGLLRARS
jgi:ABC-type branched-subunit amino acid transport system substrate-binding protein